MRAQLAVPEESVGAGRQFHPAAHQKKASPPHLQAMAIVSSFAMPDATFPFPYCIGLRSLRQLSLARIVSFICVHKLGEPMDNSQADPSEEEIHRITSQQGKPPTVGESSGTAGQPKPASHPLSQLSGLGEHHIELLHGRWIDTVESFVGVTATSCDGLCKLLGITNTDMEQLLSAARSLLGDEEYAKKSTPKIGGPTGVPLTDEQKRVRAQ